MKKRTPERENKLKAVLDKRHGDLRIMLCDLRNEHNISAIIRSCDFFGVQHVDIITSLFSHKEFPFNKQITKGVEKWMDIQFFSKGEEYKNWCKKTGYKYYLTMLDENALSLDQMNLNGRISIGFGNEGKGFLDEALIEGASGRIIIPGRGFSQSLNVSVSAGVTLWQIDRNREFQKLQNGKGERILESWRDI